MEREYTRYPAGMGAHERKKAAQRRVKEQRSQERKARGRAYQRRRLLAAALLLCLALFLAASLLVAVVHAATFQGDQAVYDSQLAAANAPELEALLKSAPAAVAPPVIAARSAILMDPDTLQVLYEKNADEPRPNASTTKILTAIIALENCSLSDQVLISKRAATTPEQSIWLQEGETLTVEQLLYAVLLRSANDASVALAEHVAGSVEAFAELMNKRAAEMGATGSNFVTPSGLHDQNHYTTARDLALIASFCLENQVFRKIIVTESYELPPSPGNTWARVATNHNRLLGIYPYAIGIKTGYTVPAGMCLVGAAEKDGRNLVSVVLNGGEGYFQDSATLLGYGFESFTEVIYARAGEDLFQTTVGHLPEGQVTGAAQADLVMVVRLDRLRDAMSGTMRYRSWVDYPVEAGQALGTLTVNPDGHAVESPLAATGGVEDPGFFSRAWAFFLSIFAAAGEILGFLVPGMLMAAGGLAWT